MQEIMQKRYPVNEWNIYAAQASDGDNWNDDSPLCCEILKQQIMPIKHSGLLMNRYVMLLPSALPNSNWSLRSIFTRYFDSCSSASLVNVRINP